MRHLPWASDALSQTQCADGLFGTAASAASGSLKAPFTTPSGINDLGQVSGTCNNQPSHGFIATPVKSDE